ncbi:hypothetical protein MCOR24_011891, partial [Pyricularia oryzae]
QSRAIVANVICDVTPNSGEVEVESNIITVCGIMGYMSATVTLDSQRSVSCIFYNDTVQVRSISG